jgi:hypothetical protein
MRDWLGLWSSTTTFRQAFSEVQHCIHQTHRTAETLIQTPDSVHAEYRVALGPIPASQTQLRFNLFSTLFQSVYLMLGIPEDRRLLYGQLNHLFRIWVTGADNLLDQEDKVVLPLEMPGESRIMRQVVSIMAADRILYVMLEAAATAGTITRAQVTELQTQSLQFLLPSAAQEASEERGIDVHPNPDHVLWTIHKYKTGLLFHIPFLGLDSLEPQINTEQVATIKSGLMDFGLGCQILDDIRDIARDLHQTNHNYLLSQLYHDAPACYRALATTPPPMDSRPYQDLPGDITKKAAALGFNLMKTGLDAVLQTQPGESKKLASTLARGMFDVLDLADLSANIKERP